MPGGNFDPLVGKTRPGTYFNFESVVQDRFKSGNRGTVIIPLLNASWGEAKKFIELNKPSETFLKLGYNYLDSKMLYIKETFKRASKVLVYVPSAGTKASVTIAPLTITAKCGGVRGNDIKVVIVSNPLGGFNVSTYVGLDVADTQEGVTTVQGLVNNDFVLFTGTGALVATAGTNLTGGADAVATNQEIIDFLDACETQSFNALAFPTEEATLQEAFKSKVLYFRNEMGKNIAGVTSNMASDFEGITNVKNGVILADGTALTAKDAVAWVAGASASAMLNESLTYTRYDGAVDANPRLKHSEIVNGLNSGEFLFTIISGESGEFVGVEQDINSLTTVTPTKGKKFKKNRVIRVLDGINNDIMRIFGSKYIGKLNNNPDGWTIAKGVYIELALAYQGQNALKNVDPDTDFVIDEIKSVDDEMWATLGAQPVDSTEKFYFTVQVK